MKTEDLHIFSKYADRLYVVFMSDSSSKLKSTYVSVLM